MTIGANVFALGAGATSVLTLVFVVFLVFFIPAFVRGFREGRREPGGQLDPDLVLAYGRVWKAPYDQPRAALPGHREDTVEAIVAALGSDTRRSILLVGEHGVGKTALLRAALDRLPAVPLVFEAGASDLNAGAGYVGELERRVAELADHLDESNAIWVFPAFEESLTAGAYEADPRGLVGALLPRVETGLLTLVGELEPAAHALLVARRPRVASLFEIIRVDPLGERDAVSVARDALVEAGVDADESLLRSGFELAQQFLPGAAPPANVLALIRAAADAAEEDGRSTIEYRDLLATLQQATGLPLTFLDASAPLSLDETRGFFEQRIIGQAEAIDAILERITLVKAGLTDPTRPLGVFLFVGPTGTGKTELAKALAEFLFGSPERLVRLDMSEFQTAESLERLLADRSSQPEAAPLIASVRRQPFSVVLLDEFEKAAEPIWDVFLALFDDGRVTDRGGRVCDFRRTIVILTSNVGGALATGPAIGFERDAEPFRTETVERALRRSFRPEFLNRIDRVVVFRPLPRSAMRALLEKELRDVLERQGLRGRPWAIEWDDSAVELLIERGFSPEYGARPLKRALERELLAPLARAIVERRVPEGEQFLLLSAPGRKRIEVAFVDPDAPPGEAGPEPATSEPSVQATLAGLVADPRPDQGSCDFLLGELERVERESGELAVGARKAALLASLSAEGFWDDPNRFEVLAEAEYLDRFETASETAARLGERLGRAAPGGRDRLVRLLAQRLYVLDASLHGIAAGATPDVFVHLRAVGGAEAVGFADELARMYEGWAERCGMRLDRLAGDVGSGEHVLAVSGLGASVILSDETGLHVLELADEGRGPEPRGVFVVIAPWEPGLPGDRATRVARARQALAAATASERVVRRYRREPSPLVRDAVRGYRTGRLDRVLAGDFDVVGG